MLAAKNLMYHFTKYYHDLSENLSYLAYIVYPSKKILNILYNDKNVKLSTHRSVAEVL